MTNSKLFYKEATPRALNEILLRSPFIKEHSKLIPRIVRTLNTILRWNYKDEGFSSITRTFFANCYGSDYTSVVLALETLGLMRVCRTWIKNTKCYDYYLTPKCQRALADVNREYLYKLLQDKPTIRRNQKQISKRGYNTKVYGDIRDTLKDTIDGITIDLNQAEKVIDTMPDGKKAFVYSLLIDVVRKDYSELHRNDKDGRIWTPYTQLPAEIKKLIRVNGLDSQMTMDIRSCYPSLWAEYVSKGQLDPSILAERNKWNALFLNKSIDPKSVIAKAIGISRDDIKPVMIQYFNGKVRGKAFRAFDAWLGEQFPYLYSAWKSTDIKQTGNNIGKLFETKLMLDESIYAKADELGIVIGYEYDGMSFYAKNDDNCQPLLDFIEQRSVELLGIKLVFVDKVNTMDMAQLARENDMRHLEASHKKWVAVCRHTFRKGNRSPNWEEFRKERQDYYGAVSHYVRTMEHSL
jgi:hypothetical protein